MQKIIKSKKQRTREKFSSFSEVTNPAYAELFKAYGLDTHNFELKVEKGMVIEGTLMGVTQNEKYILVDIGHKDYVMIETKKDEVIAIQKMGKDRGDKIEVMITEFIQEPFFIGGSFISLDKKAVYEGIMRDVDSVIVTAKVLDASPAGFRLEVLHEGFKIPAFMPNTLAGINKLSQEQSTALVGTEIDVMVETYQEDKGTFVVSRKKYLQTLIPQALDKIEILGVDGKPVTYSGTVTGTTKFGVFVEFHGCLTGMIHSANLSAETSKRLQAGEVKAGEAIEFHVKENIKGKLILTQVWRITLWDTIAKDDTFEVPVKEFKKFGALIQLDQETVGLVHNSEIEKNKKTLKAGDIVKVKVISVQRTERKIFLGLVA